MPETGMHFWDGVLIGMMLAGIAAVFALTYLLDKLDAVRRDRARMTAHLWRAR